MDTSHPSEERLRQAVEAFWETFPAFWHKIGAHIREVAAPQFDISTEQFHVLRHIRKGQGSVSRLAVAKRITRAATSQAVDALVNKGLVTRTRNTQDRRHVQLDLTAEGNVMLDSIFDNTRRWMMRMLAPLSDDELQVIISAMEALRRIPSA
jgi:DNA-binding MarR family transcriptional regulator